MADTIDAHDRALIAAFPKSRIQRIPTGVSSIPLPVYDEREGRLVSGLTRSEALHNAKDAMYSNQRRAQRLRRADNRSVVCNRCTHDWDTLLPEADRLIAEGLSLTKTAAQLGVSRRAMTNAMSKRAGQ